MKLVSTAYSEYMRGAVEFLLVAVTTPGNTRSGDALIRAAFCLDSAEQVATLPGEREMVEGLRKTLDQLDDRNELAAAMFHQLEVEIAEDEESREAL